jgi:hypothetical protein
MHVSVVRLQADDVGLQTGVVRLRVCFIRLRADTVCAFASFVGNAAAGGSKTVGAADMIADDESKTVRFVRMNANVARLRAHVIGLRANIVRLQANFVRKWEKVTRLPVCDRAFPGCCKI